MLLPLMRFLFTAFLYVMAAVSLTFLGRPMDEAILSSSLNANARFLSVAFETLILRCHFLRRYSCALFLVGMLFPYESLFFQEISVDRPLSWMV